MPVADPHAGQPVLHLGPRPDAARLSAILIHGRGASAEDILGLAREFGVTDVAYLAPQAAGNSWYLYSFLTPPQNEPWLTSALGVVGGSCRRSPSRASLRPCRDSGLLQGACLQLEFAARNATRYAAAIGLSGGLIGPPGTPRVYPGSLDGTPVFLGCSGVDAHVPVARVLESAAVLRTMKASVDERSTGGWATQSTTTRSAAVTALLQRNAHL